jgi:hypothetical protein
MYTINVFAQVVVADPCYLARQTSQPKLSVVLNSLPHGTIMTIFDANRHTCIIKVFNGWWLARMVKNRGFPVFAEYGISVHRPSWPLSDM